MVLADETYMRLALELARQAAEEGEVPVGAVIVRDGEVIATGPKPLETARHALAHAEIEAIAGGLREAGRMAAFRLRFVRDAGALPHVRGGHHQRPAEQGRPGDGGSQGRLLRVGGRFVRPALQPPARCW